MERSIGHSASPKLAASRRDAGHRTLVRTILYPPSATRFVSFYPTIKLIHIAAVFASGALFFLRGLALHLGAPWVMAAPLRFASYTIDTILLTAALLLAIMLHQYPFVHGWLTMKVVLLVVYIVLGSYALKRGQTRAARIMCWLAALAVYAFIISVARTHDVAGFLRSG